MTAAQWAGAHLFAAGRWRDYPDLGSIPLPVDAAPVVESPAGSLTTDEQLARLREKLK